jgi:hypothetical protein
MFFSLFVGFVSSFYSFIYLFIYCWLDRFMALKATPWVKSYLHAELRDSKYSSYFYPFSRLLWSLINGGCNAVALTLKGKKSGQLKMLRFLKQHC